MACVGDCFTRAGFANVFDSGDQVANLAGAEFLDRFVVWCANTDLFDVVGGVCLHEQRFAARLDGSVDHADRGDHAAVRVEMAVEDQRLRIAIGVAGRRRRALDDRVE